MKINQVLDENFPGQMPPPNPLRAIPQSVLQAAQQAGVELTHADGFSAYSPAQDAQAQALANAIAEMSRDQKASVPLPTGDVPTGLSQENATTFVMKDGAQVRVSRNPQGFTSISWGKAAIGF